MKALELIKKGWTQGTAARDKDGGKTPYDSPDAVCWCSTGAIWKAYGGDAGEATRKLIAVIGRRIVYRWNDMPERTHAEVIAAFEKAGI